MRNLLLAALALLGALSPAEAQFSGGGAGNKAKTAAQLEAGCDAGTAQDCGDLGVRYAAGEGVPKNPKAAAALFQRACDGGDGFGCAKLANAYDFGEGVKKDNAKAALYADRGCKAGEPFGCVLLGAVLTQGAPGYPKDLKRAESLFRNSCFGGNATSAAPDSVSKLACPALAKLTGKPACETKTFTSNRTGTTCYGNDGRWLVTMAPVATPTPVTVQRAANQPIMDGNLDNPLMSPPSKSIPYTSSDDVALADRSLAAQNLGNHSLGYELANQACARGVARGCFYQAGYYKKGLVVPRDSRLALSLYVKSCTKLNFVINEGCYLAGEQFFSGDGVTPNKDVAISFYKLGCQSLGAGSGSIAQSCTKYQTLAANGPIGLEAALSPNPDAGVTAREQAEVLRLPSAYANLCLRGNVRACFAVNGVVDSYFIDGLSWSEHNKSDVLRAMQTSCSNNSIKYRVSYCYAANALRYHIAKKKGFPDPKDPRWCFSPTAQYQKMKQCLQYPDGSVDSCHQYSEISGYNVKNHCSYSVDYDVYGFGKGVKTVAPNQSVGIGANTKFKWVAAHRNY